MDHYPGPQNGREWPDLDQRLSRWVSGDQGGILPYGTVVRPLPMVVHDPIPVAKALATHHYNGMAS
jgi:hypothetical protein